MLHTYLEAKESSVGAFFLSFKQQDIDQLTGWSISHIHQDSKIMSQFDGQQNGQIEDLVISVWHFRVSHGTLHCTLLNSLNINILEGLGGLSVHGIKNSNLLILCLDHQILDVSFLLTFCLTHYYNNWSWFLT